MMRSQCSEFPVLFISSHCLTLGAVLVLVFVFSLALGLVLVSFAERTEELVLGNGGFGTVTVFAQQHLQGSKGRYYRVREDNVGRGTRGRK